MELVARRRRETLGPLSRLRKSPTLGMGYLEAKKLKSSISYLEMIKWLATTYHHQTPIIFMISDLMQKPFDDVVRDLNYHREKFDGKQIRTSDQDQKN